MLFGETVAVYCLIEREREREREKGVVVARDTTLVGGMETLFSV
jgi:hypothetical protein